MRHRRHALFVVFLLALSAVLAKSSSGWTDATTQAVATRSKFEIHGVTGQAMHTHGGPPAQLGHASFIFANRGDQARHVSVVDIEFLQGSKDCDHPPSKIVSHPKSGGILLSDGKQRQSAPEVEVKAGATVEATVGFTAVLAYYAYCDRFAFRVYFHVDGEKLAVIDEVNITREEPLRRRGQ